jgi:hypothetical protein
MYSNDHANRFTSISPASSLSKQDSDELNRWRHSTFSLGRRWLHVGCDCREERKRRSSLCTDWAKINDEQRELCPHFETEGDWRQEKYFVSCVNFVSKRELNSSAVRYHDAVGLLRSIGNKEIQTESGMFRYNRKCSIRVGGLCWCDAAS